MLTTLRLDPEATSVGADGGLAARRGVTLAGAAAFHLALGAAAILLPLLYEEDAPDPPGVRVAFLGVPDAAPPPPPPPPPAAPRAAAQTPRTTRPSPELIAPAVVPEPNQDESVADLAGPDDGVPEGVDGGVEGGIAGGVVGGVLGGLGSEPEPVVRVGGQIQEPRILHDVPPVYPPAALAAHATGIAILELLVGRDGRVKKVDVLQGAPMFAEAAAEAVRQRRYQPLLLSGIPIDFVVTVTIRFNLRTAHA